MPENGALVPALYVVSYSSPSLYIRKFVYLLYVIHILHVSRAFFRCAGAHSFTRSSSRRGRSATPAVEPKAVMYARRFICNVIRWSPVPIVRYKPGVSHSLVGTGGCSFQFGRTSMQSPRAPQIAQTTLRLK